MIAIILFFTGLIAGIIFGRSKPELPAEDIYFVDELFEGYKPTKNKRKKSNSKRKK